MQNSETVSKSIIPTHKRVKIDYLKTGKIFTDDEFPAEYKSLFIVDDLNLKKIWPKSIFKWIRAKDLCSNPTFFEDFINKDLENSKFGKYGFIQGIIFNDIYFLLILFKKNMFSAIELLGSLSYLRLIADTQNFSDNYTGFFHFKIWYKYVLHDVIIDE